jgi:hypothetical protein
MGSITTWDHANISSLNPNITLPAGANITLVYSQPPSSVEMTAVLLRALSNVSTSFAAALEAAGGSISRLVPASAIAATGTTARLAAVQVRRGP